MWLTQLLSFLPVAPHAIAVGRGPNYVVFDSGKNELFTPNMGDDTVSVILDGKRNNRGNYTCGKLSRLSSL